MDVLEHLRKMLFLLCPLLPGVVSVISQSWLHLIILHDSRCLRTQDDGEEWLWLQIIWLLNVIRFQLAVPGSKFFLKERQIFQKKLLVFLKLMTVSLCLCPWGGCFSEWVHFLMFDSLGHLAGLPDPAGPSGLTRNQLWFRTCQQGEVKRAAVCSHVQKYDKNWQMALNTRRTHEWGHSLVLTFTVSSAGRATSQL